MQRWFGWWPLPVGKCSMEQAHIEASRDWRIRLLESTDLATLLNMMPFERDEEALWALRVERDGAVLDLFGLASYRTEGRLRREGATITAGELAFVLRGQGTSLVDLVPRAQRWWSGFSGRQMGKGRPRDTGTWASAGDFKSALRSAVEALRAQGGKVTQEAVARHLNCDVSTLKRWCNRSGIDWKAARAR